MIKVPSKDWFLSGVIILTVITISLSGCKKTVRPDVSFYYWKTILDISENEKTALKENNVSRIYVRYFDVILKDQAPIPLSPVHFKEIPAITIVPVIYIKNEVLLQPATDLNLLAGKIWNLMEEISNENKIISNEFQLDCDWTLRSKDNYFTLIELLKRKSSKVISVTIRLHQIKYFRKTGVPPVDRGVLMYYNMGKIAPDTLNSIYERGIAKDYIQSLGKYPLPLNIALPIFSWGVHIRNNKVIGLINKVDKESFISDSAFSLHRNNVFYIKWNNLNLGYFFEKGDEVKIESVSANDLKEMGHDLKENLHNTPNEIIFYDLDAFNLKNYNDGKNFFQKICGLF